MEGFTRKNTNVRVGRGDVIVRGWDLQKFSLNSSNVIFLYVYEKLIYNVIVRTGEGHTFSTVHK